MSFFHRRFSSFLLATCFALPALAAADGSGDAKVADAVFAAYSKMLESHFAVDIESVDDKGNQVKALAEYESLSRFHVKTDRVEVISTPEATWIKVDKAGWTKSSADMAAMAKQFVPKSAADLRAASSNLKDEGATVWNGQPVHAYSYDTLIKAMDTEVKAHNKVLIDAKGRIVHSESDGETGGIKSRSTQDIRYDDSIRVAPPKG